MSKFKVLLFESIALFFFALSLLLFLGAADNLLSKWMSPEHDVGLLDGILICATMISASSSFLMFSLASRK